MHGRRADQAVANGNPASNAHQYDTAMRNILKTLTVVVIMYVICATPSQVLWTLQNLGLVTIDYKGWIYYMCTLTQMCNVCVNPMVYAVKYKDFRSGCDHMMRKILPRRFTMNTKITTISVMTASTNP
jgi:Serpentine type 7TM GPCR chemoreceptor Srsx